MDAKRDTSMHTPETASLSPSPQGGGGIPWPWALAGLVLGLWLAGWLYWPGVERLVQIWTHSQTYAHGMIILPISLFLVWTRRHALARTTPEPSLLGALGILILGGVWFLGRAADITTVQTFVVVALIPALVLALLGRQVSRVLIFPLAYLFFAWPVGNFLVPMLQDFTAWISVALLRLSGIPTFSEGHYISIPAGDFVVAEVCSGIRYLIASVALGLVYAYLVYRSLWRRLAFVALSILVPIVANGLRAYGIILIAHWTDMERAVGVDHLIYGWLFFGLVMFLLFWTGTFFREDHFQSASPDRGGAPFSGAPSARRPAARILPLLAAVAALALAPAGEAWMDQRMTARGGDARPVAPQVAGWRGPLPLEAPVWTPDWAEPDDRIQVAYASDAGEVAWQIYHYRHDRPGTDLIRYDNRIQDGRQWRRIRQHIRSVALPDGRQQDVRETLLRGRAGEDRLVWHWYQVAGRTTVRPVEVKLLESWARITGHRQGSLLVTVSTGFRDRPDPAREILKGFLGQAPRRVSVETGDSRDG
ncbi:exosortase A [Ectothiorhodospira mobilis]|uniref:exosortase A n=1 Tax=Ectothiorhodospira mobilis TaxID=195064 RepID=UPI001906102D|nr:exosortase A [Ectothiorhodospira mobilis]